VTIRSIPTTAVVALYNSTPRADFGGCDGWAMSKDYAMHALPTSLSPRPAERAAV
jgi:hypothetical protein